MVNLLLLQPRVQAVRSADVGGQHNPVTASHDDFSGGLRRPRGVAQIVAGMTNRIATSVALGRFISLAEPAFRRYLAATTGLT